MTITNSYLNEVEPPNRPKGGHTVRVVFKIFEIASDDHTFENAYIDTKGKFLLIKDRVSGNVVAAYSYYSVISATNL